MKAAIMQPYFFPYMGYWQLLAAVDVFVIFDDVNFRKKSFINRNYLLKDCDRILITLQLLKASQNKLIKEIMVGENQDRLLRQIKTIYRSAPCYDSACNIISTALLNGEKILSKYIGFTIEYIASLLGISTRILYSSELPQKPGLRGQERIISIVEILQADCYVNAIGGMELYDEAVFRSHDIDLRFMSSNDIQYKQHGCDFVNNLSIIDTLMHVPKDDISQLVTGYKLVGQNEHESVR